MALDIIVPTPVWSCMQALERRVRPYLEQGRTVVIAGDFNISPAAADRAMPIEDASDFATRADRVWLHTLLASGGGPFIDTFRLHHPDRCLLGITHVRRHCPCWPVIGVD